MPHRNLDSLFCPAAEVVRDFCLEELYPQFLFRYLTPRQPINDQTELHVCTLVHVDSPSNFVLQLDSDRRASDRLSFSLAKIYDNPEHNRDCVVTDEFLHCGVPVAARYMISDDLRWYRGIIVEIDRTPNKEKPIRVRFVDYGNYQTNERHQLKLMPIDMGNEPPLAMKCRIKGTNDDEELPKTTIDAFKNWSENVLKDHSCLANFCYFDAASNQHVIRIYNASNGEEYLLPPDGRNLSNSRTPPLLNDSASGPSPVVAAAAAVTVTIPTVDDLIRLDADESLDEKKTNVSLTSENLNLLAELGPLGDLTVSAPDPNSNSTAVVGAAAAGSSSLEMDQFEELKSIFESASKDPSAKGTQTEVTFAGTSDSASGGDSIQYNPFTDPQFKDLMEKYPNLIKYLKHPY